MSAICLTFGEQAETHVGMEIRGNGLSKNGYNDDDFQKLRGFFEPKGFKVETLDLCKISNKLQFPKAKVLVIRNGVFGLRIFKDKLMSDLEKCEWDKKYYDTRRGKVLNKHARYNLCFGNESQEPDYENKKGRVVAYKDLWRLKSIRKQLMAILYESDLQCEGNYYQNLNKMGIGFHGDSERKKVIGINLTNPNNIERELHYKWYKNGAIVSDTCKIKLRSGDIYIMSEKASGYDWKRRGIYTLRHSAGVKDSKYLK